MVDVRWVTATLHPQHSALLSLTNPNVTLQNTKFRIHWNGCTWESANRVKSCWCYKRFGRGFVCGGTRNKKRAAALSEVNKQKATVLFVEISPTRVRPHHVMTNLVDNACCQYWNKTQEVAMKQTFPLNSNFCPLERQIRFIVVSC